MSRGHLGRAERLQKTLAQTHACFPRKGGVRKKAACQTHDSLGVVFVHNALLQLDYFRSGIEVRVRVSRMLMTGQPAAMASISDKAPG